MTRRLTRKLHDCPHTNATTNATCEARQPRISCVWRTVSSHSSHHPQEVLLAQFCLYVDEGGLEPDSFHCDNWRDENVTVLKMVAMPIALAYVVALVRFGNDQIMCLKTDATSFKADNHVTNSSYIEMIVCMSDTVNDGKISHYKMM